MLILLVKQFVSKTYTSCWYVCSQITSLTRQKRKKTAWLKLLARAYMQGKSSNTIVSQTILENQLYKRLFLRPFLSERDRFLILSISRVVCFNTSRFSVIPLVEEIGNIDNFLNRFQSVLLNSIILISFVLKIVL